MTTEKSKKFKEENVISITTSKLMKINGFKTVEEYRKFRNKRKRSGFIGAKRIKNKVK